MTKYLDYDGLKLFKELLDEEYSSSNNSSDSSGGSVEVIDNLTSTDTDAALSANLGRVLNEAIEDLETTVTNNTTSITTLLSAIDDCITSVSYSSSSYKITFTSSDGTTTTVDLSGLVSEDSSTVEVIDNLTSTSTTAALSANLGYVLSELIDDLESDVSTNTTNISSVTSDVEDLKVVFLPFDGFLDEGDYGDSSLDSTATNPSNIKFLVDQNAFGAYYSAGSYCLNWNATDEYYDNSYYNDDDDILLKDKIYIYNNELYIWSENQQTLVSLSNNYEEINMELLNMNFMLSDEDNFEKIECTEGSISYNDEGGLLITPSSDKNVKIYTNGLNTNTDRKIVVVFKKINTSDSSGDYETVRIGRCGSDGIFTVYEDIEVDDSRNTSGYFYAILDTTVSEAAEIGIYFLGATSGGTWVLSDFVIGYSDESCGYLLTNLAEVVYDSQNNANDIDDIQDWINDVELVTDDEIDELFE